MKMKMYVMTADRHFVGEGKVGKDFVSLEKAAWVADTGRFSDFLKSGIAYEVEPIGKIVIPLSSVVGIIPVAFSLPLERK